MQIISVKAGSTITMELAAMANQTNAKLYFESLMCIFIFLKTFL
jgi:hypothetical protein